MKDPIFEFFNSETGEYEYDYIIQKDDTLSWRDVSIHIDPDSPIDVSLGVLYDMILEKYPYLAG